MSRALTPLDENAAAAITTVVDEARAAAAAALPVELVPLMRQVDEEHAVPLTGHKLARLTGLAGQISAHDLRLRAASRGADEPWTAALAATGTALDSWDWHDRMRAALDLHDTYRHLTDPPASVRPVRLVFAWLTHAGGRGLVPVTVQLCQYVLDSADEQTRAAAWFSASGRALLARVAERPLQGGNATLEERQLRARLRAVVHGLASTGLVGPTELAGLAGVTKVTASAWARGGPMSPRSGA